MELSWLGSCWRHSRITGHALIGEVLHLLLVLLKAAEELSLLPCLLSHWLQRIKRRSISTDLVCQVDVVRVVDVVIVHAESKELVGAVVYDHLRRFKHSRLLCISLLIVSVVFCFGGAVYNLIIWSLTLWLHDHSVFLHIVLRLCPYMVHSIPRVIALLWPNSIIPIVVCNCVVVLIVETYDVVHWLSVCVYLCQWWIFLLLKPWLLSLNSPLTDLFYIHLGNFWFRRHVFREALALVKLLLVDVLSCYWLQIQWILHDLLLGSHLLVLSLIQHQLFVLYLLIDFSFDINLPQFLQNDLLVLSEGLTIVLHCEDVFGKHLVVIGLACFGH